jgi:N-acetylglucosaminyldiphosphoundecaprenol N-acetyl-beta-D-mannosaminyltransferase
MIASGRFQISESRRQGLTLSENCHGRTCFHALGVRVDAAQIPQVIERMEEWIKDGRSSHFVLLTNVHNLMEAQHDASFKRMLNSADLSVPDGMPVVWVGRLRGHRLARRVYGPDLVWDFCRETHRRKYTHFFYGGAPGVPEDLARNLKERFSMVRVVGTYSPPFRPLTPEEDAEVVDMINRAAPDVLWVGLGCPKQERWMYDHRERLRVPVMAGVGQAFDIFSGRVRQAPRWMREHGLEWLFRLLQEPRRLWRRYLIYNSQFLYYFFLELLGVKSSIERRP